MKRILQINIIALMMLLFLSPVNALNDGAYLISRSTSYVNPLTGKTEDGGENIALGDSMVGNIVEGQLLLEQTGGKYYITVGLGLASNVSNVRFKVMTSSGAMSSVSATKTGSSSANGDTVNHYRIQVSSLDIYISPIMYVSPMGRDVQFFIKPNISSAISGTGVYNSQMIPQSQAPTTSTENQSSTTTQSSTPKAQEETTPKAVENTEASQATVGIITKESLMENATGLSNHLINSKGKVDTKLKLTTKNIKNKNQKEQKASSHYSLWIIGVLGVIVVGGVVYVKKIKK
ncbi:heme-binding Shp domain-containing protein [Faecalibacillus intestinalis]|uniref:heme-binding Shp domain-containing protein n=1 Tax=Faecalibacillus intestinalis TaxID=1982626 RepID=UPI003522DCB3